MLHCHARRLHVCSNGRLNHGRVWVGAKRRVKFAAGSATAATAADRNRQFAGRGFDPGGQ